MVDKSKLQTSKTELNDSAHTKKTSTNAIIKRLTISNGVFYTKSSKIVSKKSGFKIVLTTKVEVILYIIYYFNYYNHSDIRKLLDNSRLFRTNKQDNPFQKGKKM